MGKISTAVKNALLAEGCRILSIDPVGEHRVDLEAVRDGLKYEISIEVKNSKQDPIDDDGDDDLALIDEALKWLDDLPEAAEEFADSVGNKLWSIREGVEKFGHMTDGQRSAVENMRGGILKWMR